MMKIAITGGIGSGKTSACIVFETLGVPVYYADTQAKLLMNTDQELKSLITGYFGDDIYCEGELDRRKLAEIVFNDKIALEKLNSWVHPAVARDFEDWYKRQTSRYVLEEAAIIFESGIAHRFDKVILVTANDKIRVERVCARDNIAPETALNRMKNQWSENRKIELADYIIYNDNVNRLIPQVLEIHQQILKNLSNREAE